MPERSLSFFGFFGLGEILGVDPAFVSVIEDGEEGFVPAALGTLDLSFSSARFSKDSASESVSSCLLTF